MQIRKRRSKIELLRSVYQPEKKRSTQKLICSFDSWVFMLPDNIKEKLSEEEIEQVQGWLDSRAEKEKETNAISSVQYAPSSLSRITESLDNVDVDVLKPERIAVIREAVKTLNKALRRAERRANKAASKPS